MDAARRTSTAILVVDDVSEMRETLLRLLRAMGYGTLFAARCGEDADALLNEQRFDLVLCDWNMPGMSGLELLKRVRELPDGDRIPFVMITGESNREKIEAAIVAGVTDYLLKPFNAASLEEKVEAACRHFR